MYKCVFRQHLPTQSRRPLCGQTINRTRCSHWSKCDTQFIEGKLAWHKATDVDIQGYRNELHSMLTQCTLSADILQCSDTKCTCKSYCLGIDVFCDATISTCIDVGNTCIPRCKPVGRSRPGWNVN